MGRVNCYYIKRLITSTSDKIKRLSRMLQVVGKFYWIVVDVNSTVTERKIARMDLTNLRAAFAIGPVRWQFNKLYWQIFITNFYFKLFFTFWFFWALTVLVKLIDCNNFSNILQQFLEQKSHLKPNSQFVKNFLAIRNWKRRYS